MAGDLFNKLSSITLLRRAWHLARNDSRTDFMYDSYRYADFGFRVNDYIQGISQNLRMESYHPQPLKFIDVPKSSLSVRPGSVLSIEDKIVLFAIACLIAPPLDKILPPNVYSWRVKKNGKSKDLFQDHEILKFPFLKRKTIQKYIEIVEPWYGAWPQFISDVKIAYEEEGYRYMVISDIVSYFENIDLNLLKEILIQHLPNQQKIINFLSTLFQYWAWPSIHGSTSPRGIPQGNGVSSFLGNVYLLPIDNDIIKLSKHKEIKYLRYMDDVKVLTKDLQTAREVLFLMNNSLRSLRLNIQGEKTRILVDKEISEELFDDRLDDVNKVIDLIQLNSLLTNSERNKYVFILRKYLHSVKGKKAIIRGKELRLFRRLLTGFTLLRHSGMVSATLEQLERNPDARLINSAIRYLRIQERNLKIIAVRLIQFLNNNEGLFEYQRSYFLILLKYVREIPNEAFHISKRIIKNKNMHPYVRQNAVVLIGMKRLTKREINAFIMRFKEEVDIEVKKAWMQALSQIDKKELLELVGELVFSIDPDLQKIGRFYYGLIYDEKRSDAQIKSIFNNYREEVLVERLHEVEVIGKSNHNNIKKKITNKIKSVENSIKRPWLRERLNSIRNKINS